MDLYVIEDLKMSVITRTPENATKYTQRRIRSEKKNYMENKRIFITYMIVTLINWISNYIISSGNL